ncbi:ubiquinol-cytochrome c reductase complex assembly factor 4 [Pleurodeles waltl]|uniref:ubiquinol-cytochrome c reductase complex assembly factor 4 n=1 Tax=Pleurodeles waltl TaxID=8319 RepID=UPI0037096CC4
MDMSRNGQTFKIAPGIRSIHQTALQKNKEETERDKPLMFSTSKASHRTWTVGKSFGSDDQRPWWKVIPISLLLAGFLLWCTLREETEIDKVLSNPDPELSEKVVSDVQTDKKEKSESTPT